ncbi:cardiolipin synthase [[Clostridium] aminophilum]|uniref:Cardiolipin synthase n=1 Tax=[Clostridium] aminophilum TaxID=1526 RepID=A0A1I0B2C1_9FIRM|nr:phospholipase D-like domain-containing protein [[Clostridium] aminophilum]SET00638.1 cardiolipin synthase [[Clostridium] aminophilum]
MRRAKKLLRIIFGRTTFVITSLFLQVALLGIILMRLTQYSAYLYGFSVFVGAVTLIRILSKEGSMSMKTAWVVPILLLPIFGTLLYLFFKLQPGTHKVNRRLQELTRKTDRFLRQDRDVLYAYGRSEGTGGNIAVYMNRFGRFPIYDETEVTYYPLGDDFFPALLSELERAEKFIFMEYFIVDQGEMLDSVLEILRRKAKAGVEVRFMYDGMNWLTHLPYHFPKKLRREGIRCKMFAPIRPVLSSMQNNRDHRKICVIDGETAFTGGVNLADEYINRKKRFGHWKDSAVRVRGKAAQSFTMMFLQMWNITETEEDDYRRFIRTENVLAGEISGVDFQAGKDHTGDDGAGGECAPEPPEEKSPGTADDPEFPGFVMPYADSPLDNVQVGEQVYLDIINGAKNYVHIMTPYLILDDPVLVALKYAARRGVSTVIMMPHIPDKIYAYLLARSFYRELISAGVRIYEYEPGFIHSKTFVADDEKAVVGTINLDFRSLYLHFEDAVYLSRCPAVRDVERDFSETLEKCIPITLDDCENFPLWKRVAGSALRLFAPLM